MASDCPGFPAVTRVIIRRNLRAPHCQFIFPAILSVCPLWHHPWIVTVHSQTESRAQEAEGTVKKLQSDNEKLEGNAGCSICQWRRQSDCQSGPQYHSDGWLWRAALTGGSLHVCVVHECVWLGWGETGWVRKTKQIPRSWQHNSGR